MWRPVSMLLVIASLGSSPAQAYTECPSQITRIFSGDSGMIWLFLANGGSTVMAPNHPDKEVNVSLAITALTGSRIVVVRYAADGVACDSGARSDLIGFFMQ